MKGRLGGTIAMNLFIAAAAIRAEVLVPLDGYNVSLFNERSLAGKAGLSVTGGDPDDAFYTSPDTAGGASPLFSGRLHLGAETGDPLLNAFTGDQRWPNRDHRSFISGEFRHPSHPIAAAVRYRYVDDYTDRFDSLWEKYRQVTGTGMQYSTKGVNYEVFGMVRYAGLRVDGMTSCYPYGRWHATPYYFSPLFERGMGTVTHLHAIMNKRLDLESEYELRQSFWYYDHEKGIRHQDHLLRTRLNWRQGKHIGFSGEFSYDSHLKPCLNAGAGGVYTDSTVSVAGMLYGYSDGEIGGHFKASVNLPAAVRCSTAVTREYLKKEREYIFLENSTPVSYRTTGLMQNSFLFDVRWSGEWCIPVEGEGWLSYTSDPVWEHVDLTGDTVLVVQRSDDDMVQWIAGLRGRIVFLKGFFSASLQPGVFVPVGRSEKIRFFIGSFADANCTVSNGGKNPFSVSTTFHYNSEPRLAYPVRDSDGREYLQEFTGETYIAGSLSMRIPFFVLPLRRLLSSTVFICDAGPLPFSGKGRVLVHPRGNRIGPRIYAGFEASVR